MFGADGEITVRQPYYFLNKEIDIDLKIAGYTHTYNNEFLAKDFNPQDDYSHILYENYLDTEHKNLSNTVYRLGK